MFPPKQTRPTKRQMGIRVEESVLMRLDVITETEKIKSRNLLLGSFLAFAVDLYELLQPMRAQIEAFAAKEKVSYVEALALLVERGLKRK